jgi:anti-sigma regulatory factor (Ser/Thr protein kinase)
MAGEQRWSTLALAARPDATPWARRHTRHVLGLWSLQPAVIDSAELVVSELVTNAARCAQAAAGEATVSVELVLASVCDGLLVEVRDPDPRPPRPVNAVADAEHGRGLPLVAEVAKAWGTRPLPTGKAVWCVIAISRSTSACHRTTQEEKGSLTA